MIFTGSSKKYARKTVRFHRKKIGSIISRYLQKYAEIEPHIMPFAASYSRSGRGHFHHQQKTHPGMRSALKTRLCELFNSSDCQNTADLSLFLNGAQIGLRLDPEMANPGSIWARISVALIWGEGGKSHIPFRLESAFAGVRKRSATLTGETNNFERKEKFAHRNFLVSR